MCDVMLVRGLCWGRCLIKWGIWIKSGPIYQASGRGINIQQTQVRSGPTWAKRKVNERSICWLGVWSEVKSGLNAENHRPTWWTSAPGSVSLRCGSVAALLPPLPAGGAWGADVHIANFEERHHERLLLQRSVAADEACFFGADAQPWTRRQKKRCSW